MAKTDFNNEIQPRGWSRADMGLDHLDKTQLAYLNRSFRSRLENELGIHFDQNGAAIADRDGTPRLFIIEKDHHNQDVITSANNAQVKPGTEEFWRQVQLGNVYAYPAGSKNPVQLQVSVDPADKETRMVYSKEVTAETMPAPPAKPLGFWKRTAWIFTAGRAFNKQRLEYKAREAGKENVLSKLGRYARARISVVKNEAAEFEQWKKDQEVLKARQELESQKKAAGKLADTYERGLRSMAKLYGPVPQWDKEMDVDTKTEGQGLYTREQFDTLKSYSKDEIDPDKIKLGPNGQKLTPEEFASVTLLALWDPKNAKIVAGKMVDKYVPQGLEAMGVPKEDIPEITTAHSRSFSTSDLFIDGYRANGGSFFKDYVNAGRKDAVEAFQAYQKGSPEKLAEIIAKGVNLLANDVRGFDAAKISDQSKGTLAVSGKILDLLEKDPNLQWLAEQKGMGKDQFKTLQNMRKLMELDKSAALAEEKLGEAALGGKLSRQQKHDLAVQVLKGRIAASKLGSENSDMEKNMDYTAKITDLNTRLKQAPQGKAEVWQNTAKRTDPGPGKFWSGNMVPLYTGLAIKYRKDPETLKVIGSQKGMDHLEKLADKIVEQQKLDTMGEKELFELLRTKAGGDSLHLSEAIPAAEAALRPQKHPGGPERGNQPLKQDQLQGPKLDQPQGLSLGGGGIGS